MIRHFACITHEYSLLNISIKRIIPTTTAYGRYFWKTADLYSFCALFWYFLDSSTRSFDIFAMSAAHQLLHSDLNIFKYDLHMLLS